MENEKNVLGEHEQSPEWLREQGKILILNNESSPEEKRQGIKLLIKAEMMGDIEATYHMGLFLVKGIISCANTNSIEHGLALLLKAANNGSIQARWVLDKYCNERYQKNIAYSNILSEYKGPLKGFDGKVIELCRTGLMTPIDAKLKYENGKNVLLLSANVQFVYAAEPINQELYEKAVIAGMMQWQGSYQVFGGQELEVKVRLTNEDRIFDNVVVIQMGTELSAALGAVVNIIGTKNKKKQMTETIKNHRSFAVPGVKWTSYSRKIIYMQSDQSKFDDYKELKAVAKHEFGHMLGLGDLYYSPEDSLAGVEKGTYREIDNYYISNKIYNLVMCDHHGMISNNDIEMIVLAFQKNRMQHYQLRKDAKEISEALGKGN